MIENENHDKDHNLDDKGEDKDHNLDDKSHSITINGRPRTVKNDELSFDELIDLAFDDPARGPQIVFTITFREAGGRISEGELDEGQTLKVQDGTIINVTRTDQS